MKKILMSVFFLVCVVAVGMAQQNTTEAKKQVEPVRQMELPKNKNSKAAKVDPKKAEQKKLELDAKAKAARNSKPVQAEKRSEVEN